jgi:hypothetical protein
MQQRGNGGGDRRHPDRKRYDGVIAVKNTD